MKRKLFINLQTGELIADTSRLAAFRYFKRDGKNYGCKIRLKDVKRY